MSFNLKINDNETKSDLTCQTSIYGVNCPSLKEIHGASLRGFTVAMICISY